MKNVCWFLKHVSTELVYLYSYCAHICTMSNPRKVVELFYDVVSPYSWLGFEVLCRYRNVWNIDLRFRPAYLGGVMHLSGNKPPATVPNKALYMATDLVRQAQYCNIPLRFPANPFEAMCEKDDQNAAAPTVTVALAKAKSETGMYKLMVQNCRRR
ncbi:hypothetical protein MHYP_G00026560 [Metynnis hypsauchen]